MCKVLSTNQLVNMHLMALCRLIYCLSLLHASIDPMLQSLISIHLVLSPRHYPCVRLLPVTPSHS